MKKLLSLILAVCISLGLLVGCNGEKKDSIAVAIVPLETFAKKIVKDKFNIEVAVPNGQSPESYEPTPKQMLSLNGAKVYFSIGIPNEVVSILPTVSCKKILLNELVVNSGLSDLTFSTGARDPHIWLSVLRAIKMVEFMRDEIVLLDPANADFYTKNANDYILELTNLNLELTEKFNNATVKKFIAYHPSFNYFASEYGLEAYAIESDGHEATAKDFISLVNFAKQNNIKKVFYQAETDSSQALAFANEIGGSAIKLSPLSPNYVENLKEMANAII